MRKGKIIAITGGIGSGKSLALETIENAGFKVLSSDQIVKELYKTHNVKKLLKEIFPTAVSGQKKLRLNTKEISKIAFNNKEKHAKLTKAITPLVLKEIIKKSQRSAKTVYVEVPLLFECQYENNFDKIIVIKRNLKDRIESVKKRSNLTENEIKARIKKQVDYDKKDLKNYIVIENNHDIEKFKSKISDLINSIK